MRRSRRRRTRTRVCPTRRQATPSVGTIAGVVDRVGDNISGIAQGGVTAVQDLIARILDTNKPKVSPTGSTVARTTANERATLDSAAVDGAEQTARSVKTGATRRAAASTGAKATVTTAKKSARRRDDRQAGGHHDRPHGAKTPRPAARQACRPKVAPRSGASTGGVVAAIDVDDLAGRRREPIAE